MEQNSNKFNIAYFCSSTSWGGLELNHCKNAVWMKERSHKVISIGISKTDYLNKSIEFKIPFVSIKKPSKYGAIFSGKKLKFILELNKIDFLFIRDKKDFSAVYWLKKWGWKGKVFYFMEMQLGVSKKGWIHTQKFSAIDLWACPLPWLYRQVETMTKYSNELCLVPSAIDPSQLDCEFSVEKVKTRFKVNNDIIAIGLMGRIDVQKNQLLLLQALNNLKDYDAKIKVCFLGAPTYGEGEAYFVYLKEFIKKHDLKNLVEFFPYTSAIGQFYKAMDIIIMATNNETFGMVTLEALVAGKNVIGANGGGTIELLGNGKDGYLFEPKNDEDLASQIRKALEQGNLLTQERQQEIIEHYHYENVCEMIEEKLNKKALNT